MRTALEVLTNEKWMDPWDMTTGASLDDRVDASVNWTVERMKAYGREIAQAVLKEAAERATCDHDFDGAHGCEYSVDRDSILNIEIEQFIK